VKPFQNVLTLLNCVDFLIMKKNIFLALSMFSMWSYGQYCEPTFPFGCILGDRIDDFEIAAAGFSHLGSGCSPDAYGDFTADPSLYITLEVGEDYEFTVAPGTNVNRQHLRIWIDFDGDEEFDEENELVASGYSGDLSSDTNGTISIPATVAPTTTRMRVTVTYNTAPFPCDSGASGEAHDYTVIILGPCAEPGDLEVTNTTDVSADLGWTENGTATAWDIEWGLEGFTPTGTPSIEETSSNPYSLEGLMASTAYDFYVRADCGSGQTSDWVGPMTFITDTGLSVSNPIFNNFTFSPNPVTGVLNLNLDSPIEQVIIYNMLGQKVVSKTIGATTSQLDVSNLRAGSYLMTLKAEGQTATFHLIKK